MWRQKNIYIIAFANVARNGTLAIANVACHATLGIANVA
jgi:hypothetical protein